MDYTDKGCFSELSGERCTLSTLDKIVYVEQNYRFNDCDVCLNPSESTLRVTNGFMTVTTAIAKGKWINGHDHTIGRGDNANMYFSPCSYSKRLPKFNTQNEAIIDGFNYFKKEFPQYSKKIDKYLKSILKPCQLAFDF